MEPILIILLITGGTAAIGKRIADRYQQYKQVADMATVFEINPPQDDITLPLSVSILQTP
jgi:hypothetical protein